MWNKFTEAAAEGETSLEAIPVMIVHWPGNHTHRTGISSSNWSIVAIRGNSWQTTLASEVLYSWNTSEKYRKGKWIYLE